MQNLSCFRKKRIVLKYFGGPKAPEGLHVWSLEGPTNEESICIYVQKNIYHKTTIAAYAANLQANALLLERYADDETLKGCFSGELNPG